MNKTYYKLVVINLVIHLYQLDIWIIIINMVGANHMIVSMHKFVPNNLIGLLIVIAKRQKFIYSNFEDAFFIQDHD